MWFDPAQIMQNANAPPATLATFATFTCSPTVNDGKVAGVAKVAAPHEVKNANPLADEKTADERTLPRTMPAHCEEVTAHYQAAAWLEFEALLARVAPYYKTPESEYDEIRLAAMSDLDGALQSYRLMAGEIATAIPAIPAIEENAIPEERHRCTRCTRLTSRGRCVAAQRGEIDYVATFAPAQDVLRRCAGFKPK